MAHASTEVDPVGSVKNVKVRLKTPVEEVNQNESFCMHIAFGDNRKKTAYFEARKGDLLSQTSSERSVTVISYDICKRSGATATTPVWIRRRGICLAGEPFDTVVIFESAGAKEDKYMWMKEMLEKKSCFLNSAELEDFYYWSKEIIKPLQSREIDETLMRVCTFLQSQSNKVRVANMLMLLHATSDKLHGLSEEALNLICDSISIENFNKEDRLMLLQQLRNKWKGKKLTAPFDTIFKKIPFWFSPKWMLLLPLYWILIGKSQVKERFSGPLVLNIPLSELPAQLDVESCKEAKQKMTNDIFQSAVTDLFPNIAKLLQDHPWIRRPYLLFARGTTAVDLMERHGQDHQLFEPLTTVTKLFQSLLVEDSEITCNILMEKKSLMDNFLSAIGRNPFTRDVKEIVSFSTKTFSDHVKNPRTKWSDVAWEANLAFSIVHAVPEAGFGPWKSNLLSLANSIANKVKCTSVADFPDCFRTCNNILRLRWPQSFKSAWDRTILKSIDAFLQSNYKGKEDEFFHIYHAVIANVEEGTELASTIEKMRYAYFKRLLKDQGVGKSAIKKGFKSTKLQLFFEKDFVECSEAKAENSQVLLILHWPSSKMFYETFYQELKLDTMPRVNHATANFLKAADDLRKRDICWREFSVFMDKFDVAWWIYSNLARKLPDLQVLPLDEQLKIWRRRKSTYDNVRQVFKGRSKLKDAYSLFEAAGWTISDSEAVSAIPPRSQLPQLKLQKIAKFHVLKATAETVMWHSSLVTSMTKKQENIIFKTTWKRYSAQESPLNASSALELVKHFLHVALSQHQSRVIEGKVCLSEVRQWLAESSTLEKEFYDFCSNWSTEATQQSIASDSSKRLHRAKHQQEIHKSWGKIKCCQGILQSEDVVHFITERPEIFGFVPKSIEDIQEILKHPEVILSPISDDLTAVAATLKKHFLTAISRGRNEGENLLSLLKDFVKEKDFIHWLRTALKDVGELNAICDLVLTSEVENKTVIINAFTNAVNGFAPLIFDIQDKKLSLDELLKRCLTVKKNAESNLYLKLEWKQAAKNSNVFQEREYHHGFSERRHLKEAQDILHRGNYIFNLRGISAPTKWDVLSLVMPKDDSYKGIATRYSLADLHHMQSLLSLTTETVYQMDEVGPNFSKVVSFADKLAEILANLTEAGYALFQSCKITVSAKTATCVVVQISLGENVPTFGEECEMEDAENLVKILTKALESWKRYVEQMRMKYYFLNEYSVAQISYLCHQLAKYSNENMEISGQVLTFLSSVNGNIEESLIRELILQSERTEVNGMEEHPEEDFDEGQEEDDSQSQVRVKLALVQTLIAETDYSEELAKAAIHNQGEDQDECIRWMMLNQHKEAEQIEEYSRLFDEETGFRRLEDIISAARISLNHNSRLGDIISHYQNNEKNLKAAEVLSEICGFFTEEPSTVAFNDCLTIGHLGRFLEMLEQNRDGSDIVQRCMPAHLKSGVPNLHICREDNIWHSVLHWYTKTKCMRLPSPSEILLCTTLTAIDEIECFMRRAICKIPSADRRLFCLARMDRLGTSEMQALERIFNKLDNSRRKDREYQLVLVCSDPNNYLASRFEMHSVKAPTIKTNEITEYLLKQLTTNDQKSVASVFGGRENCCVRIVGSSSSGAGKSLYIQRKKNITQNWTELPRVTTIRFLEKSVNHNFAIKKLLPEKYSANMTDPHFIHIDITTAVETGIDELVFNLFVLGAIGGNKGKLWLWKRHPRHLYMIEITDESLAEIKAFKSEILNLLPRIIAYQPAEIVKSGSENGDGEGMDTLLFKSTTFQRPYQYLKRMEHDNLDSFSYTHMSGSMIDCISVFLKHCPVSKPTWAQLSSFAKFLDLQLDKCEKSVFCNTSLIRGLKTFAVRLMIRMSKDFALTSKNDSEFSLDRSELRVAPDLFGWNKASHPYIFFNEDGQTMTFINVRVNESGDLLADDGTVLEPSICDSGLRLVLQRQGVEFKKAFNTKTRNEMLQALLMVLGIQKFDDPDPTYELNTDNVQKIIATYMQLCCGIPVILLGETGCGKTRLVQFLSALLQSKDSGKEYKFISKKIYGGISIDDIQYCLRNALEDARGGTKILLFFDEVNTTDAIYAVKEFMCDHSCDGEQFSSDQLQIIAACNPYRKFSQSAMKKLKDCGLARQVHASHIDQASGEKMKRLLYKVVPVPPSMGTFLRDFGELDAFTEKLYVMQMAKRLHNETEVDGKLFTSVVCAAQQHIRFQSEECRFVSLRDVERTVEVFKWFRKRKKVLLSKIRQTNKAWQLPSDGGLWELLQSIGVCYYLSLEKRQAFLISISNELQSLGIALSVDEIYNHLNACQDVFIEEANLKKDISRNQSLRENFFLMVICSDLRIPLFVIGKPGSSKSLAKTTIAGVMRGRFSDSSLFRELKEVRLVSYQCSALSDAESIKRLFGECSDLQKNNNPERFSSVAVLDEIGLAEDSPSMPLKILHPLLEYGSVDRNDPESRTGFFGISNWPLDPAKMNRGLFLLRGEPSREDLLKTAISMGGKKAESERARKVLEALVDTYIAVYRDQEDEFFGLRDFYSLIKSVYPDYDILEKIWFAVIRNFNGSKTDVLKHFRSALEKIFPGDTLPILPLAQVIRKNLQEKDSRFLLLLTNSLPSESLLSSALQDIPGGRENLHVIYGSSFQGDQNFSEVCRNIHQVKSCMETGKTAVLLNLSTVYESLYDALNQHYVTLQDKRYVDIGLGSHRVKCCISPNFRLIVLEQKDKAYEQYPTPLLNRLEKHFLFAQRFLSKHQLAIAEEAEHWLSSLFADSSDRSDSLVGSHEDTVFSTIWISSNSLEDVKATLSQSFTLDAICRIGGLQNSDHHALVEEYLSGSHENLFDLLRRSLHSGRGLQMYEVVSFANILTLQDRATLERLMRLDRNSIILINVREFRFQRQLQDAMESFLERYQKRRSMASGASNLGMVLIIQCPQAQKYGDLLECAKHAWVNITKRVTETPLVVVMLRSVERAKTGSIVLQNSPEYKLWYVDEVKPFEHESLVTTNLIRTNLAELFSSDESSEPHTKNFLGECFSKALVKIEGTRNAEKRFYKRREILIYLSQDDDRVASRFREILLKKILQSLKGCKDGEHLLQSKQWVYREACDKESLQEGGTFFRAMLLRLTTTVTNVIAHFISVIDQYSNMNFLKSDLSGMWLDIFSSLSISCPEKVTSKEFTAVPSPCPCPSMECKIPFSFDITRILDKASNDFKNFKKVSDTLKRKLPLRALSRFIQDPTPLLSSYISDLVNSRYLPGTDQDQDAEMQLIIHIMEKFTDDYLEDLKKEHNIDDVDRISAAFAVFSNKIKEMGKLSAIFKSCPDLVRKESWVSKRDSPIHLVAMIHVINELKQRLASISEKNPELCLEWMRNSNDFQQTLNEFEEERMEIHKQWKPVYLLNLFLLLMIPNNDRTDEYIKVLIKPAKLFVTLFKESKATQSTSSPLGKVVLFKIVCNQLKTFHDDLLLKMLMDWGSVTCRRCKKKLKVPKRLNCGHFFCKSCCDSLIATGELKCPTCLNTFSAAKIVDASLNSKQTVEVRGFKCNCTGFFLEFVKNLCFSGVFPDVMSGEERKLIQLLLDLITPDITNKELVCEAIDMNLISEVSIFRLVHQANGSTSEDIANIILHKLNEDNLTRFMEIAIYYFESEYSRSPDCKLIEILEHSKEAILLTDSTKPSLALCKALATVRKGIRTLCTRINDGITNQELQPLLQSLLNLNEICLGRGLGDLRLFLIRSGSRNYGMTWYLKLAPLNALKKVIPETMLDDGRCDVGMMMLSEMISMEMMGSFGKHHKDYLWETTVAAASVENPSSKLSFLINLGKTTKINLPAPDAELLKLDGKLMSLLQDCRSQYRGDLYSLTLLAQVTISRDHRYFIQLKSLMIEPQKTGTIALANMFTSPIGSTNRSEMKTIRIILLFCLLNASLTHENVVKRILEDSDISIPLGKYFVEQLLTEIRELGHLISTDMRETTLILRRVLHGIWKHDEAQESSENSWTTTKEREQWCSAFSEYYVKPILGHPKVQIAKMKKESDEQLLKYSLYRFSFECQSAATTNGHKTIASAISEAAIGYTKLCSLQDANDFLCRTLKVGETEIRQTQQQGGMLKRILDVEHLELVPYLESIFKLQNILIEKLQNNLSYEQAEVKIYEFSSESDVEALAKKYIRVWNDVFPSLKRLKDTPSALTDLFEPMSLKSPIAMFLSSNVGKGRCSRLMVKYLVNIQNSLLDALQDNAVFRGSEIIREADFAQMRTSHYINIDKNRDIVPLVQTHARYEVEQRPSGKEHRIIYNIDVLEKLVQESFLKHKKKIITKGLPQMWYTQCNGIETDWNAVLEKHVQTDLTTSTVRAIKSMVTHSSVIYATVRVLTDAISALAMMSRGPTGSLKQFLRVELKARVGDFSMIPSTVEIQHILALYSLLSWRRSVLFVSRALDPYKDLFPENYQEDFQDPCVTRDMKNAFQNLNMAKCQQRLNQLILRAPDTPRNKSLARDVLPSFPFQFIEGSVDTTLHQSLPEEICFKHVSWLFKQMVEFENPL